MHPSKHGKEVSLAGLLISIGYQCYRNNLSVFLPITSRLKAFPQKNKITVVSLKSRACHLDHSNPSGVCAKNWTLPLRQYICVIWQRRYSERLKTEDNNPLSQQFPVRKYFLCNIRRWPSGSEPLSMRSSLGRSSVSGICNTSTDSHTDKCAT
jgi:hypothetical protein